MQSVRARSPFFVSTVRAAAQETRERCQHGATLRMLMFGKPGAGKGTLSSRLVNKYEILSLSTGDLLRQHIVERTPVGLQAEDIVAHGGLLPDDIMLQVVASKLALIPPGRHWILDGFPRTLGQGEMLDAHLRKLGTPLSLFVNLDVPDNIILSRISDRWVHLPSGRVYNMSYNRPKAEGFDDETGEPLTRRPDDNPEIFARRLQKFYSTTSPLLTYYASSATTNHSPPTSISKSVQHPHQLTFPSQPPHRMILATLSGTTSDEIWPKLEAAVKNTFPTLKEKAESIERKRKHSLTEAVLARSVGINLQQS